MVISPHNPATVFVAANRLFKSTDRGHSWKAISGDLTTNTDRETLDLMGAKGKDITLAKHDGVGAYGNLVTFNESPKKAGLYYTGSDDGVISVSRDDGAHLSAFARHHGRRAIGPGPVYRHAKHPLGDVRAASEQGYRAGSHLR